MKRTVEIKYKDLKNHTPRLNMTKIFEIVSSSSANNATLVSFAFKSRTFTLIEEFGTYNTKNPLTKRQMKKKLIDEGCFVNAKITKVKITETK